MDVDKAEPTREILPQDLMDVGELEWQMRDTQEMGRVDTLLSAMPHLPEETHQIQVLVESKSRR